MKNEIIKKIDDNLKNNGIIDYNYTGQVLFTLNYNQGGVTSVTYNIIYNLR